MTDLVNYIKIDGDKVAGNIATITFDIDVTGEPVHSETRRLRSTVFTASLRAIAGSKLAASGRRRTSEAANTTLFRSTPVSRS